MKKRSESLWVKIKRVCSDIAEIGSNIKKRMINPDANRGTKKVGRTMGRIFGTVGKIALTVLLVVLATVSIVALFGSIYISQYLEVDTSLTLEEVNLDRTTQFLAADPDTGEWKVVETVSGGENREWVDYSEIPENIKTAVVAMEDKRFWSHKGVDWRRTGGALLQMFFQMREGNFGGSTITQQLIKNLTDNDDATVRRKLQEIFQALDLETRYSKEDILTWYLNIIYLGQGCNGVKTAAETYFGKELDQLTLAEAACIVGITNNPYLYDPYLNPEKNKVRQENILEEMLKQELITEKECEAAINQKLVFARSTRLPELKIRSWYVDEVILDLTVDLSKKYDWSEKYARQRIFTGGYKIYMNIDLRIQGILDEVWQNDSYWPDSVDAERPQGTMIITDPYEGNILAMSGPRGEKTGNLLFNYTTMAKRQPGSSIKPVSVYAPAFDLGVITPATVLDDSPFSLEGGRAWPKNSPVGYDGRVSILTGVTKSKNTIAVKVANLISPKRSFDFAKDKMGLTTLVDESTNSKGEVYSDIGLAQMALGGLTYGVTVEEMASAYGAFVNGGVRYKCTTYSRVEDADGNLVINNSPEPTVAMKEKTAYYMTNCLVNAVQYGTGSKARMDNMPVAGKTGTTTKDYDRWFAGYTPYYVGVSWFGYDPQRRLSGYTSYNPALYMWKQVMDKIHEGLERREFEAPKFEVETANVCKDSGLLTTDACRLDPRGSQVTSVKLAKEDVPKTYCDVHVLVEVDIASNYLASPYCPDEVRKKIGLMDITRPMPDAGVSITDEGYTTWSPGKYASLPEGQFAPSRSSEAQSGYYTHAYCPLHDNTYVPPVTTPPDDGEDPGEGVDPGGEDDPGEDPGDVDDGIVPWAPWL